MSTSNNNGENKRKSRVHVQNYGLFWSRKYINWEKKTLIGTKMSGNKYTPKVWSTKVKKTDFYKQRGIYVLYEGDKPVYVGQAGIKGAENKNVLGARLFQHTEDDIGDRWDSFSWFGFHAVSKNPNGENTYDVLTSSSGRSQNPSPQDECHLLEAILISLFGGNIQNKQSGGWSHIGVARYSQSTDDEASTEAMLNYDPDLKMIHRKLDAIEKRLPLPDSNSLQVYGHQERLIKHGDK